MASGPTNQNIIDSMRRAIGGGAQKLAARPQSAPCGSGFTLDDFAVEYPNRELIINVNVAAVPSGSTLVGVTVAVAPGTTSPTTYCMGVAAESAGLPLPFSLLAASTSATFSSPTSVTGMVILAYTTAGSLAQCVTTRQFTVGG